jgi:chorismate mutase
MAQNPNGMTNGWTEWGRHVLEELERHSMCMEKTRTDVNTLQIQITQLLADFRVQQQKDMSAFKQELFSEFSKVRQENQIIQNGIDKNFNELKLSTEENISSVNQEITKLQLKSGLWGAVSGGVIAGASLLVLIFKKVLLG